MRRLRILGDAVGRITAHDGARGLSGAPLGITCLPMTACSWSAQQGPAPRRTFHASSARRTSAVSSPQAALSHAAGPSAAASLPLPEQLRTLMRQLTHSVVVCTSTLPAASSDLPPTHRAMTMSSFTSLTLAPTPLVTFNVATPSRTFDAVAASRAFNVHILSGDADGARLADRFTRGNEADVFAGLDDVGCELVEGEAARDPPRIRGRGVMCVLKCRVVDDLPARGLLRVRDHVIVVGEVRDIVQDGGSVGNGEGMGEERFGLAYTDRRYRQVGNALEKKNEN